MKIKCFACDAAIEAPDIDAVEDAFLAHGRDHGWQYPEASIRNYVRNYAEALERLTGSTERLPEIGTITVHRVDEDRIDDWLGFFDHDAFAGNPDWASCYCLEPHVGAVPEQAERPWRETRTKMVELLKAGKSFGYLAYVDGKAAGWVNASLRSEYDLYSNIDSEGPDPLTVIGVSCFVIAPPYRRHGIASALLDRVIADAASRGAAWIEAYPHNDPRDDDAGRFRGPRSMYDARGFESIIARDRDTLVRRRAS